MFLKLIKNSNVQHLFCTRISSRSIQTTSNLVINKSLHKSFKKSNCITLNLQICTKRIFEKTCILNHYTNTRHFSISNKCLEDIEPQEKNLDDLIKLFPHPKNVLHSFYSIASTELKKPALLVQPHFKINNRKKDNEQQWTCMYAIKWPEELKFHSTAPTKQEASSKAALKVLSWLHSKGKIMDSGQPIIYDKEMIKNLTKQNYLPFTFDEHTFQKLYDISKIYQTGLASEIMKYDSELSESRENIDSSISEEFSSYGLPKFDRNLDQGTKIKLFSAKEIVDLPIQNHREEFEKLLEKNRVVIVRGEPGCGKSTRIPQYILEHSVCKNDNDAVKIAVTQPRRIAAISLAERVAFERNENVGNIVGYHVRLKSSYNRRKTCIIYCTTGILLRQLQNDPALQGYTHVILDEAHERDVNTDLLMNLLRHALNLNQSLKLIVMSATIDVRLFQNYFEKSPVMKVPGFTYPVKVNFLEDIKVNLQRSNESSKLPNPMLVVEDIVNLIKWINKSKPEGAILCFLPGWDEISKVRALLEKTIDPNTSLLLSLHSKLTDDDQKKIFKKPPLGVRKIILATNIAETSVTVDDVVYVVDSGIHKENRFDAERGVICMDNHWISKSSMNQRKGRAGRVKPGESFHLFTKEKYESLDKFSLPEILRVSLTKTVLDAKVYSKMSASDFFSQLPTPPEEFVVSKAVQELTDLELLDKHENVTPLGIALSHFQLPPKLAKAMVHSLIYKCVTPVVDVATIFSSDSEMFSTALTNKDGIRRTKEKRFKDSDHLAMMLLLEQWLQYMYDQNYEMARNFCRDNNLGFYKMLTLKKLQDIHFEYFNNCFKKILDISDDLADNSEIIKGVLLSGVGTILTHRNWNIVKGRLKNSSVFLLKTGQKATITSESVNSRRAEFPTPFLLYINEMRSNLRNTTLIRESSLISPLTVLLFKNSPIIFKEVDRSIETDIEDPIFLEIQGTKLRFLCDRRQAYAIKYAKEALKNMELYFTKQLTQYGVNNEEINKNWIEILEILNQVLQPT